PSVIPPPSAPGRRKCRRPRGAARASGRNRVDIDDVHCAVRFCVAWSRRWAWQNRPAVASCSPQRISDSGGGTNERCDRFRSLLCSNRPCSENSPALTILNKDEEPKLGRLPTAVQTNHRRFVKTIPPVDISNQT